jgi:hypothetical protein
MRSIEKYPRFHTAMLTAKAMSELIRARVRQLNFSLPARPAQPQSISFPRNRFTLTANAKLASNEIKINTAGLIKSPIESSAPKISSVQGRRLPYCLAIDFGKI